MHDKENEAQLEQEKAAALAEIQAIADRVGVPLKELLAGLGGVAEVPDEKTIPLRKPVTLGNVEYTTLDLREPTAGELSKASKAGGNVDIAIALISLIAKVPRGAVEKLSQRDFQEASDFLGSYTLDGLQTGAMS